MPLQKRILKCTIGILHVKHKKLSILLVNLSVLIRDILNKIRFKYTWFILTGIQKSLSIFDLYLYLYFTIPVKYMVSILGLY